MSKITTALWCLFLLSLPFQLGKHFWFSFSYINGLRVDYLSPAIYLQDIMFGLIVIFTCHSRFNRESIKLKITSLPRLSRGELIKIIILLLFLISNFSISFSPCLTIYSFLRLFQFVLLIILSVQEKEKIKKLLKYVLPISAISQLVISIAQVAAGRSVGGLLYWLGERSFTIATPDIAKAFLFNQVWFRPYGTFSHPNSLAGFMLFLFVLSMVFLTGKTKWLTATASILVVVISFSQSAWLGLFIVLLYLFLSRSSKKNRFIGVGVLLIFILIFVISFPNIINNLINQLTTSPSLLLRLSLLQSSWSIFTTHPIFGVGLGNFIIALSHQNNYSQLVHWYQPVHNIFVLWIVETGVVGVGIVLYLVKNLIALSIPQLNSLLNQQPNTPPNNKSNHLPNQQLINIPPNNKIQPQLNPLPYTYLIPLLLIVLLTTGVFDHYWYTLIQNRLLLAVAIGLIISCYDENQNKITQNAKNNNAHSHKNMLKLAEHEKF